MDNWPQPIPRSIEVLLHHLTRQFEQLLTAELVGVYVHGSLALGGFNPRVSDVDLLVVVHHGLAAATKHALAHLLLAASDQAPPKGLELSVVTLAAVQHFQHPTPYEFHFSDAWKERYRAAAVDLEEPRVDPDLAAHFPVTRARGRCLGGSPIEAVFRPIPAEYYLDSILRDARAILVDFTTDPVYGVLNLCRVLAYLRTGQITSKVEGGEWGLQQLDPQYAALIGTALDAYRHLDQPPTAWDPAALAQFADYMCRRLPLTGPSDSQPSS